MEKSDLGKNTTEESEDTASIGTGEIKQNDSPQKVQKEGAGSPSIAASEPRPGSAQPASSSW